MFSFILRRLLWMIPSFFAVSVVAFTIIQLPPGDFVTSYAADLATSGSPADPATLDAMRLRYGLDQPMVVQYFRWVGNALHGDLGMSFEYRTPVADIIWNRLGMTALVAFCTLLFVWIVAFPIGVYSAVRQYSIGDYIITFLCFLGMATPNFLLALFVMYLSVEFLGYSVGGLFSPDYVNAPWDLGRVGDLLTHLWIPVVVLGVAGIASLVRIMRANLLDELGKPYVETGRAKGLPELKLILRYPTRVALNPFISTVGWILPVLVSGDVIVSSVLSLPTAGPILIQALKTQDMYLGGALIMFQCILVLIGTLLSDILLVWFDPRIRYDN
ncbi:ABC transporter permease [Starkeya sp. ORNL1]|uniref:ABC transporter permease n=1 Tax=Starkeya sp. ORNL1 TaxID=2709380 RepID=UPI0014636810|nr:ABC transporter permease [Starkeya sp. ORNL1]QJP16860.1 ABC transporter permease [Starkeya sp. ORNL1]